MALLTQSKAVRAFLAEKAATVCENIFDQDRPQTYPRQLDKFIVVALKNKVPHSSISEKAYIQFHIYVKDGANGMFRDDVMQDLIDGVKMLDLQSSLFVFNGSCVETDPKVDGLGFHAVVLQYPVTLIKQVINN
jgi:hypothetical protein